MNTMPAVEMAPTQVLHVLKDSREFRGPVELFLASVAEWNGDVVRMVMAA